MADSAVEQIIAAIQTTLGTITGIGEIQRDGVDALSIEKYPAAVISVENDTPSHLLNEMINREINISITCWVRVQKDVSKALEAFKALVREKMAADPHFGLTNLIDSLEGPSSGPFPMNMDLCEAAEIIQYTVYYRTMRTNPFTLIG